MPSSVFALNVEPRQWRVMEFTFESKLLPNEASAALEATFSGPTGWRFRIPGFADGEGIWKLRFTPPLPGEWTAALRCPADPALDGQTATFAVAAAAGENPLQRHGGFLQVSPNQRYLTYADGTPFFWLGDTWWFCPSDLVPIASSNRPDVPSMYRALVDTRARQGFSTVHLAFLGTLATGKGVSGAYQGLFENRVDAAYWRAVDQYLTYANEQGLIPIVGLGFHTGLNAPTLAQLERLWGYFLARYAAYAVGFLICGEYNLASAVGADQRRTFSDVDTARVAKMMAVGQFIKDHDPYRRAVTIHPWWYGGEQRQAWTQPWYDFILVQGGHGKDGPPPQFYLDVYHRPAPKPLLEGEVTYEGIAGFPAAVVRHNAYKALQCGSFGFTYGAHGLWYPTQDEQDQTFREWGEPIPWWRALAQPGAAQLRHLRTLYESLPWWRLAPVSAEAVVRAEHVGGVTNFGVLVKALDDQLYVVYVAARPADQPPAQLAFVGGRAGASYTVALFDPRTGATTTIPGEVAGGAGNPLPALPDEQDWVLVLRRQEAAGS